MENFSSALKLTNLDDFITPSQNCVKPEIISKKSDKRAKIEVRGDGTYLEIMDDGKLEVLETAKISLNDCLACSGCVTTAESVLITAQSAGEFVENLKKDKVFVVSLSPQSRASLAAHYKLSALQTHKKLKTFFKQIGVKYLFDTTFSREFALLESAHEFVARYKKSVDLPLPMLASSCPGWICYAEKTHGEFVLPYISTTKSPQQIMGSVVKDYFAKKISTLPSNIYHVTIMPCFDKKLEASRDDFYSDILNSRDVDLVLATNEMPDLFEKFNVNFVELEESPLDDLFCGVKMTEELKLLGTVGGGSGGYLEYIYKVAAQELFGLKSVEIKYKPTRNQDLRVAVLEIDGKPALTFATAYGFKNIQNIVRKLKQGKEREYDFVEIMACPSGCLNGGGQLRPEKGKNPKEFLKEVETIYQDFEASNPEENVQVKELYKVWLDGIFAPEAQTKLHTQYHAREKVSLNPLLIKW